MKKTTFSFVHDRKNTATNKKAAILQIRFTRAGRSVFSSTGFKLKKNEWVKAYDLVKGHPSKKEIQKQIDKIKEELDKYLLSHPTCSIENLKGYFEDIGENLYGFIDKEESKRKLEKGSSNNTKALLKHLRDFRGDIPLKEVDKDFILKFTDYLFALNSKLTGKPLKPNTIRSILNRLKFFTKRAVNQDKIDKDPFRASEIIKVRKGDKKKAYALNNTELIELEQLEVVATLKGALGRKQLKHRTYAKDVFLFSCYTFLPFIDVFNLEIEHIFFSGENITIKKKRQKVKSKTFILPLYKMPTGKKAIDILKRYIGDRKKGKVFVGMVDYFQLSRALIHFSRKMGLIQNLTPHSGRQTAIKWYKENTTLPNHIIAIMSSQEPKMVAEYAGNEENRLINALP